jgi:hypothetical protein
VSEHSDAGHVRLEPASIRSDRERLTIAAARLAHRAAFAAAITFCAIPVSADQLEIGPWLLNVEQSQAVAALDDPSRTWTLTVRCMDGHVDLLVRRLADEPTEQSTIRHYAGSLQVDSGDAVRFQAQTWSLGGILVPDALSLMPAIEAGRMLRFAFAGGSDETHVTFTPARTREALQPVRQACQAPLI